MTITMYNGKPATCIKCRKKITLGGRNQPVTIENNGRIPELEDTLYFCSREHFKSWAKSYKSNRQKQNKAAIKQHLLDNAEKKAETDDIYAIHFRNVVKLEDKPLIKAGFEKQSHRIPKCCL